MACMYVEKYETQAQLKVLEVAHAEAADLIVMDVEYPAQALGDALWCYVNYATQAHCRMVWVKHASQADLKVFKTRYAQQAGWQTDNHAWRGRIGKH